ncbi:MAG: Fe(2+) transporter permease subunit FeoB [Gammaproteobacteria bacterium]|nr:Fe(2+) transporter permease subunit FeoB [Gammaproteobacteria bacterium]
MTLTVGLVGNPNSGKTTLFNALTGANQSVGNWPGVTVERKTGTLKLDQNEVVEVVDLPGIYSIDALTDQISVDEQIARDYLVSGAADVFLNIVDASNLERNLYLTAQLLEAKVPLIVVLNMMDAATQKGLQIDVHQLQDKLGCPVVPIIASRLQGIKQLISLITTFKPDNSQFNDQPIVQYHEAVESALQTLIHDVSELSTAHHCHPRWLALRILEEDSWADSIASHDIKSKCRELIHQIESATDEDLDILIADGRYQFARSVVSSAISKTGQLNQSLTRTIDAIVLNRILGIPIFLLVMYLLFLFTIHIGSAFIDFFNDFFGVLLIEAPSYWIQVAGIPNWINLLITNGLGAGIQVVTTFIPVIGCLFLFMSFLEDSGYMARAAFIMDRFMRVIGLPGKAFVPLLVGFGCNVPAIMSTRTMENQRDRILTITMNPFMSCGARLPVYALFAAVFFPLDGQNVVFVLYLFGIFVAVLTGLIMKHTLFRGESSPFLMELPPYRLPTIRGLLLRTWDRLKGFVMRAGKVIVPVVLVLNILNTFAFDGSVDHQTDGQSVLAVIGKHLVPAFEPMGITEQNWPAAVGIFTGILAKEVVVGTLDALYSQIDVQHVVNNINDSANQAPDIVQGIGDAFATIPANLSGIVDTLLDPLGMRIEQAGDHKEYAEIQGVDVGTYAAMQHRFDGRQGAFAYLLFILLYMPCVAAIAAVYREAGRGWAIFIGFWTTGLAYLSATGFYQIATWNQHPQQSATWTVLLISAFLVVVTGLWVTGRYYNQNNQFYQAT